MYLRVWHEELLKNILGKILVPCSVYPPENVSEYKVQNVRRPNIDSTVGMMLHQLTTHSKVAYIFNL